MHNQTKTLFVPSERTLGKGVGIVLAYLEVFREYFVTIQRGRYSGTGRSIGINGCHWNLKFEIVERTQLARIEEPKSKKDNQDERSRGNENDEGVQWEARRFQ